MSDKPQENTKAADDGISKGEEDKLSELFDSALQDFGKTTGGSILEQASKLNAIRLPPSGAASSAVDDPPLDDLLMGGQTFDPEFAKHAAKEFQNMLLQLGEMQKEFNQSPPTQGGASGDLGDLSAAGASAAGGEPEMTEEEKEFASNLLKNLSSMADKAGLIGQAKDEKELMEAMSALHSDDTYTNEFLPFMEGLMSNLLSKDMLYPSLKQISLKYPQWIEEHKDTVPADQMDRYEKQLEMMKEICNEYDAAEQNDDSPEAGQVRYQRIMGMLQQMQMLGQPPHDLVGDLPGGWDFGLDGLPQVTDQKEAAAACSIM